MEDTQVSTIEENAIATDADAQLIAYLEDILSRQLERLRRYDLDGAFQLAEESGKVAEQVTGRRLLGQPQFQDQRERIQGLYREICLVIAAERDEVSEKLKKIREGIRTLSKYSGQ